MTHNRKAVLIAAAVLFAPLAFAEGKKQCEAECDETSTICEEAMLKKLGKDNKSAAGQAKKLCADAAKQCKAECK